ncbi:MAG: CHRD domain-containing protein [Acidimicrobiia bacterium]|nr:CHRD domain-containing protein [Acidimicrobiia bacterium]
MGVHWRPRLAIFTSLVLLGAFMTPAQAGEDDPASMLQTDCDNPPAVMAVDDITRGMTGKAYTTLSGRTISEFDVEVLGILPGAIYPLIDLILVEASGPAVEAVGGIAGGFSGSPVYIDGKLIGAIAYGFFGNSFIAGLTPATDMLTTATYPAAALPQLNAAASTALEMIEASVGALGSFRALPVPVGIGGVSPRWIDALQAEVETRGLPFTLYPATGAGSGGSATGSPGMVLPGESMSAVLTTGDNFAFGTGTATYCDGSTVIGWGHPFFWTGDVTMSMNEADVVTVVEDTTGFGNFKVITLGEQAGRIDFDGNAAMRGIAGEAAPSVPITSSVEFAEFGTARDGRTDAYLTDDIFFSLGWTAASHLITNLDSVRGTGLSPGSSIVEWTVEGTRADGSPFDVSFDNKYWDPFIITDGSAFEMASFIDQLLFNPFEDVAVTSVDVSNAELFSDRRTIDIVEVRAWTTSNPEPVERYGFLSAAPGDVVTVEMTLRPWGGAEFIETAELVIPAEFTGGFGSLFVHGGSSDFFFFDPFFDDFFIDDVTDFDELLAFMEGRDHNYDLVAELDLFQEPIDGEPEPPNGEFPEPPDGFIDANGGPVGQDTVSVKAVIEFDSVVTGDAFFDLEVFPPSPPVEGLLVAELDGAAVPAGGDPDGSGFAELYFEGDQVMFDIVLDGVDEPITSAHIHAGAAGEEGPVVIDLEYEANGLSGVVFADPFLLEEMLAVPEFFYLQVHSESYPDGAVRGQLASEIIDEVAVSSVASVTADGLWQVEGLEPFYFGAPGDIPFLGDWDGDGLKTPGLYRPGDGFAYIRDSLDTGVADHEFFMGIGGDIPLVGDWDGDGTDTFGVYRPTEAKVYLRNSNDTGFADVEFFFGAGGDVPFTGDFDGDGITEVGLHRSSAGQVFLRLDHTTGVADLSFYWGINGDRVMAGDWDGDGMDTVGLARPSTGMFYVRNHHSTGIADAEWTLAVDDPETRVIVD